MSVDKNLVDMLFVDEDNLPDPDAVPEEEKTVIRVAKKPVTSTILEWLGSLFSALAVVLIIMTFCFRVIDVDGTSMEPTLIDTDKVVITDLFYTPHNGDIVIISHATNYDKPLVKRVIATAGQDVRIDFANNEVYVDGQKIDEPYIQGMTIPGDIPADELNGIVPEGKVFVMGDNRNVSLDSRYREIGYIDETSIIGKAQIDLIPHKRENGQLKFDIGGIRYLY